MRSWDGELLHLFDGRSGCDIRRQLPQRGGGVGCLNNPPQPVSARPARAERATSAQGTGIPFQAANAIRHSSGRCWWRRMNVATDLNPHCGGKRRIAQPARRTHHSRAPRGRAPPDTRRTRLLAHPAARHPTIVGRLHRGAFFTPVHVQVPQRISNRSTDRGVAGCMANPISHRGPRFASGGRYGYRVNPGTAPLIQVRCSLRSRTKLMM